MDSIDDILQKKLKEEKDVNKRAQVHREISKDYGYV